MNLDGWEFWTDAPVDNPNGVLRLFKPRPATDFEGTPPLSGPVVLVEYRGKYRAMELATDPHSETYPWAVSALMQDAIMMIDVEESK